VSQPGIRVGITLGDPAGIGPEIVRKVLAVGVPGAAELHIYGDANALGAIAPGATDSERAAALEVHDCASAPVKPGSPDPRASAGVVEAIRRATADCLAGRIDALVTAPISKELLGLAGFPYPGHTELLGELCGAAQPVMLLTGGGLRVVPATIHCALREVPERIAALDWSTLLQTLASDLSRSFGLAAPRIALCALNPHAGDGGRFGDEEARVLAPALAAARARGIDVSGPLPADSIFTRALGGEFDCVVGCYHDQVLGPLKLHAFGRAVNVTLGLPIVRTSVDHGTAFDIAGTGRADPSSLGEALKSAIAICAQRRAVPALARGQ